MLLIVHQYFFMMLSRKIIVCRTSLQTTNNFFYGDIYASLVYEQLTAKGRTQQKALLPVQIIIELAIIKNTAVKKHHLHLLHIPA
jgi:hypothetical protein